jgi:hypothetical protein
MLRVSTLLLTLLMTVSTNAMAQKAACTVQVADADRILSGQPESRELRKARRLVESARQLCDQNDHLALKKVRQALAQVKADASGSEVAAQ